MAVSRVSLGLIWFLFEVYLILSLCVRLNQGSRLFAIATTLQVGESSSFKELGQLPGSSCLLLWPTG